MKPDCAPQLISVFFSERKSLPVLLVKRIGDFEDLMHEKKSQKVEILIYAYPLRKPGLGLKHTGIHLFFDFVCVFL
jgi:hypothetical protein